MQKPLYISFYDTSPPVEVTPEELGWFFQTVLPHLNGRQRRVVLGASAELLGRGGRTAVDVASGMSRTTVIRAVNELALGPEPIGRQRAPGGGDKPAIEKQEGLLRAMAALLRPRGWPQSAAQVLWTSRSTYALADELSTQGFSISAELVRRLLREVGFTLRRRARQSTSLDDPGIDAQFTHLNSLVASFADDDQPVLCACPSLSACRVLQATTGALGATSPWIRSEWCPREEGMRPSNRSTGSLL
jgi:hypothetical protein